jgi:hypothetical protein
MNYATGRLWYVRRGRGLHDGHWWRRSMLAGIPQQIPEAHNAEYNDNFN